MTPPNPTCPNCHGSGTVEIHYFDAIRNAEVYDYLRCDCTRAPMVEEFEKAEDWTND